MYFASNYHIRLLSILKVYKHKALQALWLKSLIKICILSSIIVVIWLIVNFIQFLSNLFIWHWFWSKFSKFVTNFALMPKASKKVALHEPNGIPTSATTSLMWFGDFHHVSLHLFDVFVVCWCSRAVIFEMLVLIVDLPKTTTIISIALLHSIIFSKRKLI